MGCTFNGNEANVNDELQKINRNNIIHVASLNYCGILKSPFEFYSGQFHQQLKNLSTIFQKMKSKHISHSTSQTFQWHFSKVDKKVKEKRYCPFYNIYAGIVQNKFISKDKFKKIWFAALAKVEQEDHLQISAQEKEEALQFDLTAYHTLLHYVYQVENIDEMENKEATLYLSKFQPFFGQSFLDQQKKIKRLQDSLQSLLSDIIFIQEASEKLIEKIVHNQNFYVQISSDKDTLICIKKDKFPNPVSIKQLASFSNQDFEMLDWNNHSCIVVVDKYILIAGHLSSNSKLNKENVENLKRGCKIIMEKYQDYQIICGADINSFLGRFTDEINIFPKQDNYFTSLKKRTSMQVQTSKAQKVIKESKDSIFTTLPIIDGEITTIDLMPPNQDTYLPCQSHPFDHFLLFAKINKHRNP